jgi:hypothetical protein
MNGRTTRYLTLGAAVATFAALVGDGQRPEEAPLAQATLCAPECAEADDAPTEQPVPPART